VFATVSDEINSFTTNALMYFFNPHRISVTLFSCSVVSSVPIPKTYYIIHTEHVAVVVTLVGTSARIKLLYSGIWGHVVW
jgi:hypothetical protein